MAAVIVFLSLLLAVNVLLIRWVRKSTGVLPTTTQTNEGITAAPPHGPRAALSTIPALSFDDKEGAQENLDHLGHWDRRTWVGYNAVDFGTGVSAVVAVVSCSPEYEGRTIYFHLDRPDGPVFAELIVPATHGFEALASPVGGATGVHDVFITCTDGGFNLQSIKCVLPQSATNLIAATSYSASRGIQEPRSGVIGHTDGGDWVRYDQIDFGEGVSSVSVDLAMGPKDAKIEFHLDKPNGPLIATLIPRSHSVIHVLR